MFLPVYICLLAFHQRHTLLVSLFHYFSSQFSSFSSSRHISSSIRSPMFPPSCCNSYSYCLLFPSLSPIQRPRKDAPHIDTFPYIPLQLLCFPLQCSPACCGGLRGLNSGLFSGFSLFPLVRPWKYRDNTSITSQHLSFLIIPCHLYMNLAPSGVIQSRPWQIHKISQYITGCGGL